MRLTTLNVEMFEGFVNAHINVSMLRWKILET